MRRILWVLLVTLINKPLLNDEHNLLGHAKLDVGNERNKPQWCDGYRLGSSEQNPSKFEEKE